MEYRKKFLWLDKDSELYHRNHVGMFDLTKGILMVLIILQHCINDYFPLMLYDSYESVGIKVILSPLCLLRYGAVPMLFMICGYGMRKQSVRKSVKKNLQMFIVPYLGVVIAVTVIALVKHMIAGGSLWSRLFYQVLPFVFCVNTGRWIFNGHMEQIGPVWFFFVYTFGAIYVNLVLQEKEKWLQVCILGISAMFALLFVNIPLPFCIQQIFICAGLMYTGMQLKKYHIIFKEVPIYIMVMIFLLCCVGTVCGGWAEFANNIYGLGAIDLIIAYIAGVVLLCLFQKMNILQGNLADRLRWIGRHMMWFCCFHTITYVTIPWERMTAWFGEHYVLGCLTEFVFSFLWALLGSLLAEIIIKKYLARKKENCK